MINKIKKSSRLWLALGSIVIILLIIGITLWSISGSRKTVEETVNKLSAFYLEELVGKRAIVLRDSLDRDFKQLEKIVSLLKTKGTQDMDSLHLFLADAQTLSGTNKFALVDEDGTVYSSHSIISDASRYAALRQNFTEPGIIASNLYGAKKQVVVAVPVNGVTMEGKNIIACIMHIDIEDIAGSLIYESENGAGNISVGLYNKSGENLTVSRFGTIEAGQNLLSYIRSTRLVDEASMEETERSFRNGEKGVINFHSAEGDTAYIYYMPVEKTDWMLTVLIHDNTIADQLEYSSQVMLRRNSIQLVSVSVLIICVFLIIGGQYKKNSEMRSRQAELELKAQNEEELRSARDAAESASRAKSEFLFNMSHDIRTPMNAIIGFADIMETELNDPEKLKLHLAKQQEANLYLLSIINNVLDMARIESGKTEINTVVTDLFEEQDNAKDLFRSQIQKKNLRYTESRHITHRYIYADAQKMRQVIVNLLSNSVKYTPAGGSVAFHVEELPCEKEGYATYEITISDTGIGMSKEFLEHIFESFSREHATAQNNTLGTGLGMAIVKKLVEMQGGTVSVQSEPGKGTTFRVTVMQQIAEAPEKQEQRQEKSAEGAFDFHGRRILLAEDNDINAEITTEILEQTGVQIERAEDGAICVDMLTAAAPGYYDLILMDIQMPRMNGYQAAEAIRLLPDAKKAGIPIIAMTANAFEEDKKNAFRAGMNEHLAKPIDVKKLMETVNRFIR